MAACFAGEPSEMSKGLELGLFCLAGHKSSRGPGVGGVETANLQELGQLHLEIFKQKALLCNSVTISLQSTHFPLLQA
jgi:hypothetical protein